MKKMTKKQAIAEARRLRAEGKKASARCYSGITTVPGKGIVAFVEYYVRVEA